MAIWPGSWALCRFMLVFSLVHLSEEVVYLLSAPLDHVALVGDVTIAYEYSPDTNTEDSSASPVIQLFDLDTQSVIVNKPLPQEGVGSVSVECSYFDHSGQFVARLRNGPDGKLLNNSNIIEVSWPVYRFRVPKTHEAFSSKLKVIAVTSKPLCTNMEHNRYENDLLLVFQGGNSELENDVPVLSARNPVKESVGFLRKRVSATFNCEAADQTGLYSVALQSRYKGNIISTIFISVLPSSSFSLSFNVNSTSFCNRTEDGVTVTFGKPNCTLNSDKLRLYADTSRTFSRNPAQSHLHILSEQLTSEASITFGCNTFRNSEYSGYCFIYVVEARSGAVSEQTKLCLPTRQNGPVIDGNWGEWSAWGECTATCGDPGMVVRYRSRLCDNPPTANGGIPCEGNVVDAEECKLNPCSNGTRVVKERDVLSETTPGLSCNSVLHGIRGEFIASPQICPTGATWLIQVSDQHQISLHFESFNLYLPQEYVRIRDGSQGATVLAFHTGQIIPNPVYSSGNQMFIEYEVYEFGKPPNRGFTATYDSIEPPESPLTPPATLDDYDTSDDPSFTELHGTIILATGIGLLILLLLLSLVMTVIIRFKEEKHQPGNIQPIYTGPRGSFNSSTTRSNQRLYGLPGHSTTSPSEQSHQSVSKRGFPDGNGTTGDKSNIYILQEGSNLQYLPETSFVSSSYHTEREITPISELPSPYQEETGPKWPPPKKNMVPPNRFADVYGSIDEMSRQSVVTDKNTVHLTNKTPSEFAMRGYSAHGSNKGSRTSVNESMKSGSMKDKKKRKTVANVENTDNSSPYVSPDGQLTSLGLDALQKKSRTDYNRSPEGAESPENFIDGGKQADARIGYGSLLRKKESKDRYVDPVGGNHSDIIKSPRRFPTSKQFYSDRSVTSPDSNLSMSGSNNPTSPLGRHHHHHHQSFDSSGKRRRSPGREESRDMKDSRSGRHSHGKRRKSPSSPRSKRDVTSPRSDRSGSSRGSARRSKSGASSKSSKHGGNYKSRNSQHSPKHTPHYNTYSQYPHAAVTSPETPIASLSPTSDPSPIHLPKPLSIKQNRQQLKQVFLSDESLMAKTASGPERSGAESTRSGRSLRQLPNTPPSSGSSPTKRRHGRRVYSDKSLSPSAEEPEYDDYMPSVPGSYFFNIYPESTPNGAATDPNQRTVHLSRV